ncbi:hypothetical protein D3C76_1790680 [compost metagenome]
MAGLDELPDGAVIGTDTGDIQITLSRALPLSLDFATDTGRTSANANGAELTLSEKHRLKGKLSGGGPLLKVRSDTGDIKLDVK